MAGGDVGDIADRGVIEFSAEQQNRAVLGDLVSIGIIEPEITGGEIAEMDRLVDRHNHLRHPQAIRLRERVGARLPVIDDPTTDTGSPTWSDVSVNVIATVFGSTPSRTE